MTHRAASGKRTHMTHHAAIVCLSITDVGSIPQMNIWSILLIKSNLKRYLHLARSLFLYFRMSFNIRERGTYELLSLFLLTLWLRQMRLKNLTSLREITSSTDVTFAPFHWRRIYAAFWCISMACSYHTHANLKNKITLAF